MPAISTAPRVSVVIPTYNCERYLAQAVESVLSQNDCDYELLVIDDGSTDNTRSVLEPYSDRLGYIYQENQGVAAARNHGIKLAKGEFIAFLDSDDYFLSDKLAAQVARFDAEPNLGIVHSGWVRVDTDGQNLREIKPWEYIPKLSLETWLKWKAVLPSAMMFRRHWLELVGGFDPRFPPAEDTEIVWRLALKGCQAGWLRRVTVAYRQHQQSAMHKGLPQAKSLSAALDNFFSLPDLPEKIRLMEGKVRYDTLVWLAWYLYYTGHSTEMVNYLRQAWEYKPNLSGETMISWAEGFAQFSQQWGEKLDADSLGNMPEWRMLVTGVLNQALSSYTWQKYTFKR